MSASREAIITLSSVIDNIAETGLPTDEPERSESRAIGTLVSSPRGSLVSFTETTEGGEVKTKIEILADKLRVVRSGAIVCDMLFSEGVAHNSVYGAPPYSFDVSVYTRRIRGEITADGGEINIFYFMEIGGAKKSVRMKLFCEVTDGN